MLFRRLSQRKRFGLPVPALLVLGAMVAISACRRPAPPTSRTFPLKGQILAVDAARQELTVKHEDIAGFMPAMTMAYAVRDPNLMKGRTAGELITATLVVEDSAAYLRAIAHEGTAPVAAEKPAVRGMDLLGVGEPVREAELVDQRGERRAFADWHGQVVAVTFVYTRCPLPNFCPLMDRHFAAVQEQIRSSADLRGHVRLVSVTIDPEHDTPAVLLKHAAGLKADPAIWTWLTGSREQVDRFASQFGVSIVRDQADPSEVVHNLRTAILDTNGRLITILNGNEWQPSGLIAEIRHARGRG
jgi:protein SCO1